MSSDDPRVAAARYRLDKLSEGLEEKPAAGRPGPAETDAETAETTDPSRPARGSTAADRAAYVETAIQQAIRRGEFDDLPGAGKPIPHLGDHHDPDWWIRRKIETEKLTGLGPPALQLRVENVELESRLDALAREPDVREALEDFNKRVIEARRQLQGGPPVVTPTRDVDDEVWRWRKRRAARAAEATAQAAADAEPEPRRWWRRDH